MYNQGEQYRYSLYLGKAKSDLLHKKSQEIVKFATYELQEMIDHYTEKIKMHSYK